jgi:hypothetical protein
MKGLELEMQCFQGGISTHHLLGGTIGLNALKKSFAFRDVSCLLESLVIMRSSIQ